MSPHYGASSVYYTAAPANPNLLVMADHGRCELSFLLYVSGGTAGSTNAPQAPQTVGINTAAATTGISPQSSLPEASPAVGSSLAEQQQSLKSSSRNTTLGGTTTSAASTSSNTTGAGASPSAAAAASVIASSSSSTFAAATTTGHTSMAGGSSSSSSLLSPASTSSASPNGWFAYVTVDDAVSFYLGRITTAAGDVRSLVKYVRQHPSTLRLTLSLYEIHDPRDLGVTVEHIEAAVSAGLWPQSLVVGGSGAPLLPHLIPKSITASHIAAVTRSAASAAPQPMASVLYGGATTTLTSAAPAASPPLPAAAVPANQLMISSSTQPSSAVTIAPTTAQQPQPPQVAAAAAGSHLSLLSRHPEEGELMEMVVTILLDAMSEGTPFVVTSYVLNKLEPLSMFRRVVIVHYGNRFLHFLGSQPHLITLTQLPGHEPRVQLAFNPELLQQPLLVPSAKEVADREEEAVRIMVDLLQKEGDLTVTELLERMRESKPPHLALKWKASPIVFLRFLQTQREVWVTTDPVHTTRIGLRR